MREVLTKAVAIEQGLSRYFTGDPCRRGHLCERRAPGGHCLECVEISRAAVRARLGEEKYNERQRGYDAGFKARDPARKLASSAAAQKRMRERDPERVRLAGKAWRLANHDKVVAVRKRHYNAYKNTPKYKLAMAAAAAKYRMKKNGFDTPMGLTAIVRGVWEASGGKCAACSAAGKLELDHILALANGGDNAESNFQFLCGPCNRSKAAIDFNTWLNGRQLAA